MNRHVKRSLVGLVATVLLVVVAAVVIAAFFQEAVGKKLISQINKQLKTELKVGSFDLSLLRNFPNATASLRDVKLMGLDKAPLLEAQEVAFNFRLLSLFESQVKIHSVSVSDGALKVHVNKAGKANYDIFKPSKSSEESKFNIALENARLERMELIYQDDKLRQDMMTQVESATFSGLFSEKKFDLKSKATLASNFIDLDDVRYFEGKKWGYDAVISVDLNKGKYSFEDVRVLVEENAFNVKGFIQSKEKSTDFDLKVAAEDASLESVIALMPAQFLSAFGDFSSTGRFKFAALVKGKLNASERPSINFEFGLDDGKLSSPRLSEPFKDVSFDAHFTNGEGHNNQQSIFEISNFKGYLNRQLITLSLRVEDLDDPQIDLKADGAIAVGDAYGLLNNPAITGGGGEMEIQNLSLKGYYSDMVDIHKIINVSMTGDIVFDDATLDINGEKLVFDTGKLLLRDNQLTLEGLKMQGAGSEINLQGSVQNLLPVLLADSLNSENAHLDFTAQLTSPVMDIAKLIKLTDVPVKESEVQAEVFDSLKVEKNEDRHRITDLLKGTFNARVDEFTYNKIEGRDFNGELSFEASTMRIKGDAAGMEGSYELDGTVFFEKEPRLEAKVDCESIDVKKFFQQTDNAGQTVLKAENISGDMNAKLLIHAFWDSTGVFQMDKLHVWAGVGIRRGELKNFEMLDEFATYAKIQDLRNVRFEDMQNWLEVKNSTFYLPVMFLQNNAMNLTIGGEQSFDDRINYGIKVNAGQVLANKFKKGNRNVESIPSKENGFFNLYFLVSGTLDQNKYETNKRKVKEMFERSESQKRHIKAELIKAFGAPLNMVKEPKGWEDKGDAAPADESEDEYIPGF
ncbi:MAG: AsmA family protein [Saprospiraceae bacterium]|nr:AsmA family protein [Saprospiraceae bacterium]